MTWQTRVYGQRKEAKGTATVTGRHGRGIICPRNECSYPSPPSPIGIGVGRLNIAQHFYTRGLSTYYEPTLVSPEKLNIRVGSVTDGRLHGVIRNSHIELPQC